MKSAIAGGERRSGHIMVLEHLDSTVMNTSNGSNCKKLAWTHGWCRVIDLRFPTPSIVLHPFVLSLQFKLNFRTGLSHHADFSAP